MSENRSTISSDVTRARSRSHALSGLDLLLTETEAAELIGFSRNTLRAWRVSGRATAFPPPPFIKCGRSVRYRASDLQQWMAEQVLLRSTSDQEQAA
ncbi:MAG: transcriptional regulator [Sedimenticola sp.]|jgi:excisionase family DNA binding protein|nr:MAG: transcriptional regulator [Sedimenticola sp.]